MNAITSTMAKIVRMARAGYSAKEIGKATDIDQETIELVCASKAIMAQLDADT